MPDSGLCYSTNLGIAPVNQFTQKIADFLERVFSRSASVGARSLTDGVVNHGPAAHGQYLEYCKIAS